MQYSDVDAVHIGSKEVHVEHLRVANDNALPT